MIVRGCHVKRLKILNVYQFESRVFFLMERGNVGF